MGRPARTVFRLFAWGCRAAGRDPDLRLASTLMTKNKPKPTWKAWTTVEDDRETVHVARHSGKAEIHLAQLLAEGADLGQMILALIAQVQKIADRPIPTVHP